MAKNSIENKLTEEKYNNEETTKEEKSKVIEEPIKNEEKTLKIILNTKLPSPIKWSQCKIDNFDNHKVLLGYLNAYFDHCPILINPNIIWQLILNSFSEYTTSHCPSPPTLTPHRPPNLPLPIVPIITF